MLYVALDLEIIKIAHAGQNDRHGNCAGQSSFWYRTMSVSSRLFSDLQNRDPKQARRQRDDGD